MSPDQFRAALAALGLTQTGAAAALRVDPRTVRRWAKGERRVPWWAERMLEMMAEKNAEDLANGRMPDAIVQMVLDAIAPLSPHE